MIGHFSICMFSFQKRVYLKEKNFNGSFEEQIRLSDVLTHWLSGEKKALICSICQGLCCRYSHHV